MGFRTREAPTRGQSAIVGLVLLIGMVSLLSVGIFLVADETATSIQQDAEQERVEGAFVELGQQMQTASSTSDVAGGLDLEVGQDGAVVREKSGVISVSSDDLEEDIDDLTIGTVEYESKDGTKIAYEAGAVFRETGNETQVVSAPQIHYDAATDTLTLPVVTATGDEQLDPGGVRFSHADTKTFQEAAVVENESVTITIESDYYRGWERFFEDQTGGSSVRTVDHANQTIDVSVGYIEADEAFEDGILVSETYDGFTNADVDDDDVESGLAPELDPVIEEMIERLEDDEKEHDTLPTTDGTVSSNGTYWKQDELHVDGGLTFDISDGNSTLIVDDEITVDGTLVADADGTDHELKIYTTGNFDLHSGTVAVSGGTASQLQLYGTSDMSVGIQASSYEGTIYAPRDEGWGSIENEVFDPAHCREQVCMQANVEFTGAIMASSVNVHSASVNFEYDPSLEDNDIQLYPDTYTLPPQLTYLNVAHHEIEVENN
ncbi:DUF7289 family protein [Natronobacterium gregoryi]|uniref:DUF7305 domain-containing protein n=2 Tax=Natronobacterium gregoryi TaxID=44930 RepID=L0AC14_NATGS|nr:hypothetical protein [Natronobacterium gregoryi]AFZ71406.1 hypothetical protein Natgr_0141 [Natronobacterium gregoryi SP2]ELY66931.1 hypothetical protein C490_11863 [Natronobacterium gregoryi SP2]PLK21215.1 hypothetical protein CYV19_05195 [Natronobacterium gregoryi SP2]SFI84480.1 hypothetical protein SAMN05443661_10728 [Natronobacterium gregoryi]